MESIVQSEPPHAPPTPSLLDKFTKFTRKSVDTLTEVFTATAQDIQEHGALDVLQEVASDMKDFFVESLAAVRDILDSLPTEEVSVNLVDSQGGWLTEAEAASVPPMPVDLSCQSSDIGFDPDMEIVN